MNLVGRKGSLPRSAALIALAALAVHQLRYLAAYGSDAHRELAGQGHAYLSQSLSIVLGFAAATLAACLLRAALRSAPARPAIAAPQTRALLYALSIAAVFAVQETLEGLLVSGHASGIGAVLGGGGWLALPLAALLGTLCAALDGGLARLESLVAGAAPPVLKSRAPRLQGAALDRASVPLALLPLAFGLARRPPPPGS